ncbi:MAG: metal ABC transporter substrate-binding protein [Chloroflexi bacterium]|nr:metal ABC transporter substrate-binding protein [Chloroflexota bacterium]
MRFLLLLMMIITLSLPTVDLNAQSTRLNIVTTTTILADVVQNVAGDAADVTSLMGVGTDTHNFLPTTRDVVTIDEADIIFINGITVEGGLRDILEETDPAKVWNLSVCVPVLTGYEHEEDHEEESEEEHEHEAIEFLGASGEQCPAHYAELGLTPDGTTFFEEDCENCDPHVWFDVRNVMLWTLMIRDTLSQLDPANASVYADNSVVYLQELAELDEEIKTLVETVPEESRLLITNHGVLGYFAHRYGFEIAATVLPGFSTGVEPGPQEVLEVIQILQDTGAPAIFVDNSSSADTAAQIAEEAGVKVIGLYTESLSEAEVGAATYIDYMRYNVSQIVTALAGD